MTFPESGSRIGAAARAMYERVFPTESWDDAAERHYGGYRANYTEQARAGLAAADAVEAPPLAALLKQWLDGWDAGGRYPVEKTRVALAEFRASAPVENPE